MLKLPLPMSRRHALAAMKGVVDVKNLAPGSLLIRDSTVHCGVCGREHRIDLRGGILTVDEHRYGL